MCVLFVSLCYLGSFLLLFLFVYFFTSFIFLDLNNKRLKMKVFLASLVLVLSIAATANGLKCYVCNSHLDPACGEPFYINSEAIDSKFARICDDRDGEPFCRKTKTFLEINEETRIHRDCGYYERTGYDCYQKRSEDYISDVCQCNTDFCNSGNKIGAVTLAITIPIIARTLI